MSHPQYLRYSEGGTIYVDLSSRPSAVTVRLCDGDGTTKWAHTASNITISTITTTTNCVASARDTSINVLSNTGISCGSKFWLQDDPEEVLARRIDGETIYLRRPVLYGHVNAATVEGTRVVFSANSEVANSLWWDGHAEWNVDGERYYTAVDCTRYPMQRHASAQDLFDVEPQLAEVLEAETDVERLLDNAHDFVLMEVAKAAPDRRARVFPGSSEFATCTALAAMYLHYRRRADDPAQRLADRYRSDMASALEGVVQVTPRDADQDRDIEAEDRMSMRSVRLSR